MSATMTEMQSFYTPSTSDRISPPAPAAMNELMNRYSSARSSATFKGGYPRKYRNVFQQGIDRVRLEYYRYEVTFGLYVMTPGEKLVANTSVLIVLSLLACALVYFPSLLYTKLSSVLWLLTGRNGEQVDASLGILADHWNPFPPA
ncbi:hypothetical protein PENANT_c001G00476 [Penicillium antarcticum]|uniref:Uncharacterized protein n=1 Tax=Penicillium antarcticum TaxID=416450 RepID=A0A1V6QND3_9EURO|nr:uncharacterized protein N7508_010452 [Penicillium antarcticum]KAJ5295631.1 hypothetical protein N7508_010452 [Penicillium antarcticum]OQD90754.1 hypothetical protein PENANT_c001G00476 [Penicillium antarcticum]